MPATTPPRARSIRRSDRPAAESARACAALRRPSGRSARAASSSPTRSARMTNDAGAVHRAAGDAIAGVLLDGHRLASDHRLVDDAVALRRRRRPPGPFRRAGRAADRRRGPSAIGTSCFAVRADRARVRRRQAEQALQRRARPDARAQLQHLAEQHQRGDDDGRVEIRLDAAVHAEAFGEQPGATVAATL